MSVVNVLNMVCAAIYGLVIFQVYSDLEVYLPDAMNMVSQGFAANHYIGDQNSEAGKSHSSACVARS